MQCGFPRHATGKYSTNRPKLWSPLGLARWQPTQTNLALGVPPTQQFATPRVEAPAPSYTPCARQPAAEGAERPGESRMCLCPAFTSFVQASTRSIEATK